MNDLIQDFINIHKQTLESWLERFLCGNYDEKELIIYLQHLKQEWKTLPTEKIDAPYKHYEKEFWFIYQILYFLTIVDLDKDKKEIIMSGLPDIMESFKNNGKLPNEWDACRPK